MRTLAFSVAFLALAACGCDPCATVRVRLQLRSPQPTNIQITVDSPDTREALTIVDSVVTRHGFQHTRDYPERGEHGFIRSHSVSVRPQIDCYIELTATGMEIRFNELGALRSSPEAKSVAADVRAALIDKYGESSVR